MAKLFAKGSSYFGLLTNYFKLASDYAQKAMDAQSKLHLPSNSQATIVVNRTTKTVNGKEQERVEKSEADNTNLNENRTKFSNYRTAVNNVKKIDIKGLKKKIDEFKREAEEISKCFDEFNEYVKEESKVEKIVNRLNKAAAKLGIKGKFSVGEDGEFKTVLFTYVDPNGESHTMTVAELVNAFYTTLNVNLSFQVQAGETAEENGETGVSVEEQAEAAGAADLIENTAERTGSYGLNTPEKVKQAIATTHPEIAEELGEDAKVEDYLKKYAEGLYGQDVVLETGAAFGSLAWIYSSIVDSDAYDLTGYINGKEDPFEAALGIEPEEQPIIPDNSGNRYAPETPAEDVNPSPGGGNRGNNNDDQSVLGEQDPGSATGLGGDSTGDTGTGSTDFGGGTDVPTMGTGTGTGAGTTGGGTRTPINDLITYDDIVDGYIGGSTTGGTGIVGGDVNAISFDVGKDYDALALEQYNNSSAEIKAAGVLAVVTEANSLFDNDSAALSSKLLGMGYTDAEVAEIMQDRDLTVQAFTQNAKNEELARTSKELAEKDGDSEYVSKYGKKKSINKLRNGGEDDEETIAARQKLDDSVDSYKNAVDEANAALEKAKTLKGELESMTKEYGEDYTKWTDEQYEKYNEIANKYNDAVADARTKVEAVETAKNSYEDAKTGYNSLFENDGNDGGGSIPTTGNPLGEEPVSTEPSNPEPVDGHSLPNNDPLAELGVDSNAQSASVNTTAGSAGGESVGTSETVLESQPAAIEPVDDGKLPFEDALSKSVDAGANAISGIGEEPEIPAGVIESAGTTGIEVDNSVVEPGPVDINVDTTAPVINTTNDNAIGDRGIAISSGISNIVDTMKPGMSSKVSGELISIGAALALKTANTLINGGKKRVVINYDELAIYKYEKVDKKVRDNFDNNIINETNNLFANNKEELVKKLVGYGYTESDANRISENLDLAKEAMLDGGRRSQLAMFAKALAKEDGYDDYNSTYTLGRSISDLNNGTTAALRADLSGDEMYDEFREQYFGMERKFADFANNANRDLELLNESKDKFNKFIEEHGNDSGKWSNEEYKDYETLNTANVNAQQVFDESNKKFEDIQNAFNEMRLDYIKEKSKRLKARNIDPTNIKQLMQEPVSDGV